MGLEKDFYGISMIFLWDFFGIPMGFPMIFLLDFSYSSMVLLWISIGFLWDFHDISMIFLWDYYGISMGVL